MRSFERQQVMWHRASSLMPMGVQTMSKSPTQFVQGAAPIFIQRGRGARVWDPDGNEWLDYPMALGPVLLGYCEPAVDEAIRQQLEEGITFTMSHPIEIDVAERIIALCPGVEAVRFGKSGSDAVSAAVRAARAITGRDTVIVLGYHGWHDWYIGSTSRHLGVPGAVRNNTLAVPFNDQERLGDALRRHAGHIAAVVLEPSGGSVPDSGYLQWLIDESHAIGALTVFDEVITGFRLAPGGARERYGVEPDFSCYGKALGNGMPISAVAGRWKVMSAFENIFFSGTHGGEALSLAAARAVLDIIADGSVLAEIDRRGNDLITGLRAAIDSHDLGDRLSVSGEPPRSVVNFLDDPDLITKSFVQQRFLQSAILFNGSMFISARHTDDDIAATINVFDDICHEIRTTSSLASKLIGPPVQPVFRAP